LIGAIIYTKTGINANEGVNPAIPATYFELSKIIEIIEIKTVVQDVWFINKTFFLLSLC